jgi:hypothetical protein
MTARKPSELVGRAPEIRVAAECMGRIRAKARIGKAPGPAVLPRRGGARERIRKDRQSASDAVNTSAPSGRRRPRSDVSCTSWLVPHRKPFRVLDAAGLMSPHGELHAVAGAELPHAAGHGACADVQLSTRLRAPSFLMRLATVLVLMYSSVAISSLVRPCATGTRTSSSRAVSGSRGRRP